MTRTKISFVLIRVISWIVLIFSAACLELAIQGR